VPGAGAPLPFFNTSALEELEGATSWSLLQLVANTVTPIMADKSKSLELNFKFFMFFCFYVNAYLTDTKLSCSMKKKKK
jgi:hypothetical protein